jgi:threonine 3-dehydrogenase
MIALVKRKPPANGAEWAKGLALVERQLPRAAGREDVLIGVTAGGICGTDVGIYNSKASLAGAIGSAPASDVVIGHEFCGRVLGGSRPALTVLARSLRERYGADRVVGKYLGKATPTAVAARKDFPEFLEDQFIATAEMHVTCGTCAQCVAGDFHVCANTVIRGLHADGAFASHVVLPAQNVVLIRKGEIPEEVVAFMDAIGNATHTVQSVRDIRGKSVAVLGAGVIGLMSVAIASAAGAKRIFVTDVSGGRNTHAKLTARRFKVAEALGATACFDVATPEGKREFHRTAKAENRGAGVDAVLEMSGSYRAYEDAFAVVRMGGEVSLLGIPSGPGEVDFARNVIFPGVTIHGVIGRRVWSTWDIMTQLLKKGLAKRFISAGFVTHSLPLADFEEGFAAIDRGDALKVLLRPEGKTATSTRSKR